MPTARKLQNRLCKPRIDNVIEELHVAEETVMRVTSSIATHGGIMGAAGGGIQALRSPMLGSTPMALLQYSTAVKLEVEETVSKLVPRRGQARNCFPKAVKEELKLENPPTCRDTFQGGQVKVEAQDCNFVLEAQDFNSASDDFTTPEKKATVLTEAETPVPKRSKRTARKLYASFDPPLEKPGGKRTKLEPGLEALALNTCVKDEPQKSADLAAPKASSLQEAEVAAWVGATWQSLGISPVELNLGLTLPTGQTFRWRESVPGIWTGVIDSHVISLTQTETDVLYTHHNSQEQSKLRSKGGSWALVPVGKAELSSDINGAMQDYFNLDTDLTSLWETFTEACPRFAELAPHLRGARMLRQNPLECLFSFICSSNNHISRITGMVDHLARLGRPVAVVNGQTYHAFPSLSELSTVTEEGLRASGFGYRAKYIVGSVKLLLEKPGGGEAWLESLRSVPLSEAVTELCTLPGVGPKVAACIALFSLDKHEAVPVDTHVWQLAVRYYTPELAKKSLTPRIHQEVADVFWQRFGPYAGWALNAMFIAELAFMRSKIPEHLLPPAAKKKLKKQAVRAITGGEVVEEEL